MSALWACIGHTVTKYNVDRDDVDDDDDIDAAAAAAAAADDDDDDDKEEEVVCWLVAKRPSNMLVYLRDGSAQTILRAATLR